MWNLDSAIEAVQQLLELINQKYKTPSGFESKLNQFEKNIHHIELLQREVTAQFTEEDCNKWEDLEEAFYECDDDLPALKMKSVSKHKNKL